MPRGHQRDPKRERFWRRTVKAWTRSGETVRSFCAKHGLTETAFHAWRRELRKRDGEARGGAGGVAATRSKTGARREQTPARLRFLPVRIASAGDMGPVSMEIERDGTTIRLRGDIDLEKLVRVLDAVQRASC